MISSNGLTSLARLGFAARGLVYILVGGFAVDAALGGTKPTDNQAAMGSLADGPFGHILLAIIAIGLAGYALWRLTEAALDPEGKGSDAKGAFERAGSALSGFAHLALAFYAAKLALGARSGGQGNAPGDSEARDWSAWLLSQPGGALLLGLVALVLFVVAAAQVWKAYSANFSKELGGGVPVPHYVETMGRIGFAARGIVFTLVAWFFLNAALESDASESGGMGQALRSLQTADYGPLLLGLVALGLIAFGLYSLVEARFRRIRTVSPV